MSWFTETDDILGLELDDVLIGSDPIPVHPAANQCSSITWPTMQREIPPITHGRTGQIEPIESVDEGDGSAEGESS